MQIIIVSKRLAQAKSYPIWQVLLVLMGLLLVAMFLTLLFAPLDNNDRQRAQTLFPLKLSFNSQKQLDAYAKQLGEMQARVLVLEAQNQRLGQLAGDTRLPKRDTTYPKFHDGRGGPSLSSEHLSGTELQNKINELLQKLGNDERYLGKLESALLEKSVLKNLSPDINPVNATYNSSSFGWRIDPFTGQRAFHEGLDFLADEGMPIFAVASGIVSASGRYPDYGSMVEINHGGGLFTRYAHASRLEVQIGQRVNKGQKIAEVGSSGRSTGPHLHYEIRLNGIPLDPKSYLPQQSVASF